MARRNQILLFLVFLSCFAVLSHAGRWCTRRPDVPDSQIEDFLNLICKYFDCSPTRPGGPCYQPNTLTNHANFMLHVLYKVFSQCPSSVAGFTDRDSTYGKCVFF